MLYTLSKAAFAAKQGVGGTAVSNWLSRGILTGDALAPDGRINVAEAERQLAERLDPARRSRAPGGKAPLLDVPARAAPPTTDDRSQIVETDTLATLRIRQLRLDVEAKEQRAALRRSELVRADELAATWARELEDLVMAVEQWLPDVAMKLGLGREGVDLMRREWRAFRERQADQAAEQLASKYEC